MAQDAGESIREKKAWLKDTVLEIQGEDGR